jgi:hypothetical protein
MADVNRYREGVFTGSMGEIFETMRKLMNFTFTAIPSIDKFYGTKVHAQYAGYPAVTKSELCVGSDV